MHRMPYGHVDYYIHIHRCDFNRNSGFPLDEEDRTFLGAIGLYIVWRYIGCIDTLAI